LLAVSALAACGGKPKNSGPPKVTAPYASLVGAGIVLLRQGNTSAAEQLFNQAIAKNPSDPVAHYNLGVVYQGLGDRKDALRQYRLAVNDDPRYTPALYNAAVLIAPRDPPLAIFYYRRVIAIKPNSPTALLNLALLQARAGWPRKIVVNELRQAVAIQPSLIADVPRRFRAQVGR
jgi:tetratricopeptide (TPR) repeat protein